MSSIVDIQQRPDSLWVTLHRSDRGLETCPEIVQLVATLQETPGATVVVDLEPLSYFGSVVLEFLVTLWRPISKSQGRLIVVAPSVVGREVLGVARLDQVWSVVPSQAEALRLVEPAVSATNAT
jgi:anti-anti-sigma factor